MKVKTYFGEYEVKMVCSTYRNNNSLAIILTCHNDEYDFDEPFADLTVNLSGDIANDTYQFVDTNNCPWAEEFIEENNLGTPTGLYGGSGYCSYPLYQFNIDKIKETK